MAIPIFVTKKQIKEVCQLVQVDMAAYLGYIPEIHELSRKSGDDCRFQIGDLQEEHYNEEVQEYFSQRVWIRIKEVTKYFGEDDVQCM